MYESSYMVRLIDSKGGTHTVFVPTYAETMDMISNLKSEYTLLNIDTIGAVVETDTKQFMRVFEGETGVVA